MSQKRVKLHPSKIWRDFILPLYASEIRHYILTTKPDYEALADTINKDFHLTAEQWDAVLQNWEQLVWATEYYK